MQPPKLKAGLATLVAGLAIACARGPEPVDFADPLHGPGSPHLAIPFASYTLTPTGLLRSYSVSADRSGVDRPMIRTTSGDYLSRDFTFEVGVTIPESVEDIAYIGFGEGLPNGAFHNEPTNAFLFRIHNVDQIRRVDVAVAVSEPRKPPLPYYAELNSIANYTPGKMMRFRITRRGDQVIMSIPSLPGGEHSYKLSDFAGVFDSSTAYLFFGNTAEGTAFEDLTVTR